MNKKARSGIGISCPRSFAVKQFCMLCTKNDR